MAAQILRQTVQFLHISVFPESLHQEIKICSAAGGWRDKPLCRIRSAEADFGDINPNRTLRPEQRRWCCLRHVRSRCSYLMADLR